MCYNISMEMSTHDAVHTMSLSLGVVDIAVIILGTFIGLFSIFLIFKLNRKIGRKIRIALRFFILGVLANVTAILWTSFWGHTYTIGTVEFDVHNVFMTIGMVFFIISTYKLNIANSELIDLDVRKSKFLSIE